MLTFIILSIILTTAVIIGYVAHLDYMMQNHPHYKGEDLFDEQLDSKEITPEMIWNKEKLDAIGRFIKAHKAIEADAEKYAKDTFKWPKNKFGEDQAIPAGQSVPNGYTKHIKLTKKPFMDGALSETAKNYWYESFRNNNKEQNY